MEFVPVLVLGLVVLQVTSFSKDVLNFRTRTNAVVTQVVGWLFGVGLTFLVAEADAFAFVTVGDQPLASIDGPSKFLVGLVFLSVATTIYKAKQAIDGSDTAKEPPLVRDQGSPSQ